MLNPRKMRQAERDYRKIAAGNPIFVLTRRGDIYDKTARADKLNFSHSKGFKIFVNEFLKKHTELPHIDGTRRAKCIYRRITDEEKEEYRKRAPEEQSDEEEKEQELQQRMRHRIKYSRRYEPYPGPESQRRVHNMYRQSYYRSNPAPEYQSGNDPDSDMEHESQPEAQQHSQESQNESQPDNDARGSQNENKPDGESNYNTGTKPDSECKQASKHNSGSLIVSIDQKGKNQEDNMYCRSDHYSQLKRQHLPKTCVRNKESFGFQNYYKAFLFFHPNETQPLSVKIAAKKYGRLPLEKKNKYRGYGKNPDMFGLPRRISKIGKFLDVCQLDDIKKDFI